MFRRLLLQILFLQLSAVSVHSTCSFPDYTTFSRKWETLISQERHTVGAYWIFNQTTVEFLSLTKPQTSYVYDCIQELSNNFLVQLNPEYTKTEQSPNGNEQMTHRCVKLFRYSDNVLQVKLSPLSVLGPVEQICNESQMPWESYILVWPKITDYEACPIVGGYQFSITDSQQNQLCANLYLPPVLESRCIEDEGLNIEFRNFNCRGNLGMQLNQELRCLGSWTEGNFTFSVTSSTDQMWPRLWLFRFPIDMQQGEFSVEILSEIKVVTTEKIDPSVEHHTMHLSKKIYTSTCEDEAVTCASCNNSNILGFCQRTCDVCHTNHMGNFPNNTIGNWIQFSTEGLKDVTVSTSSMQIGDTKFSCIGLEINRWHKTKDRKVAALVFTNGCRPRYLCVDFVQRSTSVQQYRLSQYVSWPQQPSMNADDVCNEDLFAETKSKLSKNTPGIHKYKTIVTASETKPKVPCGLTQGYLWLNAHFPDKKGCKLFMNSCKNDLQTSFDLVLSDDCDKSILTENKQECIATFVDDMNGDQVVITQDSNTSIAYCWVLHKEEWEPRPRFFLTYAADCNSDAAKYILYRNYTGYISYFDIITGPDLLGSYSCSHDIGALLRMPDNITVQSISMADITTPHFNLDAPVFTTTNPDAASGNIKAPVHTSNCGSKSQRILINLFIMASVYFIVI